jgi:hypothetical protein
VNPVLRPQPFKAMTPTLRRKQQSSCQHELARARSQAAAIRHGISGKEVESR